MHVEGLGPLNWILSIVVQFVSNILKYVIENTIENVMLEMWNLALGFLDLSFVGDFLGCTPPTTTFTTTVL